MIDPVERDIVQNIYIRRVEKRDGKLVNIDIGKVDDGQGSLEDRQPAEEQLNGVERSLNAARGTAHVLPRAAGFLAADPSLRRNVDQCYRSH